jgi:diaminopimelate decarboxylase
MINAYGFGDRRFVLELGRYLAADCGWYCTEVLDIKESLGKKQVICAGGVNHFRRPVALRINHPMAVVPMNRPRIFPDQCEVVNETVFVGGPLCTSIDRLTPKDIVLPSVKIGDMMVVGLAGAYGLTMSHFGFLSHEKPPEFVVG